MKSMKDHRKWKILEFADGAKQPPPCPFCCEMCGGDDHYIRPTRAELVLVFDRLLRGAEVFTLRSKNKLFFHLESKMQSEFTVAFKAYVKKDENNSEIRYFTIDRGAENNFEYLTAKLLNVFPCLSQQPFTISWKDNESDYVTISSDNELLFALTSMSSDVKKLYISLDKSARENVLEIPITAKIPNISIGISQRKRSSMPMVEHPNTICDVCNRKIAGFRYKCLLCANYDLCQSCESQGNHSEHLMLRIPKPLNAQQKKVFQLSNVIIPDFCDNIKISGSFHGKKHCKDRKSHHKDNQGEKHGEKHEDKHHGKHGRHEKKYCFSSRGHEPWVKTFATFMNDFANLAEDVGVRVESKESSPPEENQPSTSNQEANATSQEPNPIHPQIIIPDMEMVRNAIHGWTQKFSPELTGKINLKNSGIWNAPKNGDAKNEGVEKSTATDDFKEQSNQNAMKKGYTDAASTSAIKIPVTIASAVNPNGQVFQQNSTVTDSFTAVNNMSISGESDSDSTGSDCLFVKSSDMNEKGDDWTMLNTEEPGDNELIQLIPSQNRNTEQDMEIVTDRFKKHVEVSHTISNNAATSAQPPNAETRYVLIDTSSISSASSATSAPPATPINGVPYAHAFATSQNFGSQPIVSQAFESQQTFSSANFGTQPTASQTFGSQPTASQTTGSQPTAPPMRHRDPHIAVALEQMMAMGFSNEDGWLTQLLESGNGNINRVLDILSSVKK